MRDRHTRGMPDALECVVSFLHGLDRRIPTAALQRVASILERDQRHRHVLCVPLAHAPKLSP